MNLTDFDFKEQLFKVFTDQCGAIQTELQKRMLDLQPKQIAEGPPICLDEIRYGGQARELIEHSISNLAAKLVMNAAKEVTKVYIKQIKSLSFEGDLIHICAEYTI